MTADYKEYPLVCVDFDGTIAQYDGWKGVGVFGEPIPGARDALNELEDMGYQICVFTTRGEVAEIAEYMATHGLPYTYINNAPVMAGQNPGKPPAKYFIDDRGVRFEGSWKRVMRQIEELDEIEHTRNGAAYHHGIDDDKESPPPDPKDFCGMTDAIVGIPHACWCGENLRVNAGMPDFPGDELDPKAIVTMHYECPTHGVNYDKPRGIGISGKARSGKNTLAEMLRERLGWPVSAYADALKHEWFSVNYSTAYAMNDTDDVVAEVDRMKAEDPEVRQKLIEYGQWRRGKDPEYWIKQIDTSIPQIISDVRFKNEFESLQREGYYMVRIECSAKALAGRGCPPMDDISECDLDAEHGFDMGIFNDIGLDHLDGCADEIAYAVRPEKSQTT